MNYLNFSGHYAIIGNQHLYPLLGNLPITDGEAMVKEIKETLQALPCYKSLLNGAACTVVLPSMSTAAGIFLSVWHGLFGSFPSIAWAVKTDLGFVFKSTNSIDLQDLRNEVRAERFK